MTLIIRLAALHALCLLDEAQEGNDVSSLWRTEADDSKTERYLQLLESAKVTGYLFEMKNHTKTWDAKTGTGTDMGPHAGKK